MMRGAALLHCGLAGILGLFATPAMAQDEPEGSIVVTGQRLPSGKQLRRFVRHVASSVEGQLSRFDDPVCPLMLGLSPDSNRLIEGRIRAIAAEAKVEEDKAGCRPNLIVMIAQDSDALVGALRKRFPAMFAQLSPRELRRALADGPVHVWSTIEVRNEDGVAVSGPGDDGVKYLEVRSASRINLPTQQVVIQSVLVIDAGAATGKTLTQLADYAAMRTLAGARPPAEANAPDTILSLFDAAEPLPAMLTPLDRGFLKGLYRMPLNGRATNAIDGIARTIQKDVKAAK